MECVAAVLLLLLLAVVLNASADRHYAREASLQ